MWNNSVNLLKKVPIAVVQIINSQVGTTCVIFYKRFSFILMTCFLWHGTKYKINPSTSKVWLWNENTMARPFKLNTSWAVGRSGASTRVILSEAETTLCCVPGHVCESKLILFCDSVYYAVLLNVLVYGRNPNETFKHWAGLSCSPFHYIVRVGSNY